MKHHLQKNAIRWGLLGATIAIALSALLLLRGVGGNEQIEISQVMQMAQTGQIQEIEVTGDNLVVTTIEGEVLESRKESSISVLELLNSRGVDTGPDGIDVSVKEASISITPILLTLVPILLVGSLIFFMMRRTQGGINQAMNVGKSRAKEFNEGRPSVTFDDVAGVEEAKQELKEVVEFLKFPERFMSLGARIPKGMLLVGSPGSGKTLISRAVAGEAGVPFFSTSGSEFVEMFVGVGASRVRDLFAKAKQNAPAVVFIDEIDAVGRHRGAGVGGGNDEREQTLNQILVEMDGFDPNTNVIVIAATNRPDILDPALVRPGRFDRRIAIDAPDVQGRMDILKVHLKGKPVVKDLDLETIAKETSGFSGADLANLANEAAILAARFGKKEITLAEFEEAVDRVIAGPARKSRKISEQEKLIVAYHEAGHALVAAQLPNADPVRKVTIVSRGASGGHTRLLPDEERNLWSKGQFEAMLAVMMGGQVAEELIFGDVTTGASNDLQNATNVARKMVTEYGMSANLGPRTFESGQGQIFLGKELAQGSSYSNAIAEKIDTEMNSLLAKARETARSIIDANRDRLGRVAEQLCIKETLQGQELQSLLGGPSGSAPAVA